MVFFLLQEPRGKLLRAAKPEAAPLPIEDAVMGNSLTVGPEGHHQAELQAQLYQASHSQPGILSLVHTRGQPSPSVDIQGWGWGRVMAASRGWEVSPEHPLGRDQPVSCYAAVHLPTRWAVVPLMLP